MDSTITHGDTESRPQREPGGATAVPNFDLADWQNIRVALEHYARTVAACHPTVRDTHKRVVDQLKSARGRRNHCPPAESREWIGTRLAARHLGCHVRTVRRHAEALGGKRIGRDLMFPAQTIYELAQTKGGLE
jgi:hypothetical protein